jgi:uncharacterized membrane protein YgcG
VRAGVAAIAALIAFASSAEELRPLPPVLRAVSDEARVLSDDQGRQLASAVADIAYATGVPVIVVVVDSTRPEPLRGYAERLAGRWRESRGLDPARAVFVIVATKDRALQILPGRALRLAEALHRDDPTAAAAALFARDRYYEGLVALCGGIHSAILRARRG